MLRLLAFIVIIFLVFRTIGYVIRLLAGGVTGRTGQEFREDYNRKKRASNGNIHIDYVPKEDKKKSGFKGGEYVDYEDVS